MKPEYDLIVIGGGAAGLTAAGIAASLSARTLLVEARKLGGDCTWNGCIPSKTLLRAADIAHLIRNAGGFGLSDSAPAIDFRRLMEHVRRTREQVYEDADRPEIYQRMGVEVVQARARFLGPDSVELAGADGARRVTSRYFILATGSRPVVPPVKGLESVPYLTNETLFELNELPSRLAVIGGGPIGTEMAQAFRRLGAEVTVIHAHERILPRDDPELAGELQAALAREGVRFLLNTRVERVERMPDGSIQLHARSDGPSPGPVIADRLLAAAGRRPEVKDLGLEAAGIAYNERGIQVDNRCRTSVRHIFACGDCTGRYQFTHMSEHMAKIAVTNALLRLPFAVDVRHVPWCTFTAPELAHVGASEAELAARGVPFEVYRFPYSRIDRAITDGETTGWIKVLARPRSGKILGADILGSRAGDLIGELAVAMRAGMPLRKLSDTIHPYPTYGLGNRRAADQWYIRRQSLLLIRLLRVLFGYRGPLPNLSCPERIV